MSDILYVDKEDIRYPASVLAETTKVGEVSMFPVLFKYVIPIKFGEPILGVNFSADPAQRPMGSPNFSKKKDG